MKNMVRWHSRILSKSKNNNHPSHQNSARQKPTAMGNNLVVVWRQKKKSFCSFSCNKINNTFCSQKITCEVRCLQRFTNFGIRKKVGTEPCLNYTEKQRIKWFGHLIRMRPISTVYKVFYNRTAGKKARGRPRKRWLDGIAESCQRAKITITQATRTAQDKNRKPQHWATTG